ncbi:MAG: type II secretion system F family protein [Myxococcota bacterium]|nr:type II secretion system F family protein [Myxococcota bacterium]
MSLIEDWSQATTIIALSLVGAAMVLTVTLAVQRWLLAANLVDAEKAGDAERYTRLAETFRPSGGLAGLFAAALRPAPGTVDHLELSTLLLYAGRRDRRDLDRFCAKRAGTILLAFAMGAVLILLFGSQIAMLVPPILGAGLIVPKFLLRAEAQARQARIEVAFPAALDLLEACMQAGLGLEQSLSRVAAELGSSAPDIAEELAVLVGEIRAGRPTSEAFRKLSDRVEVEDVRSLAAVVVQSASMGAPLANTLKQYSDASRKRRSLDLEERAGKVTAAVTLPLTLCLLPSALIVVLGPAVLEVMESFSD